MTDKEKLSVIKDYLKRLITSPCPDLTWFKAKEQAYKQVLEFIVSIDEQENKYKVGDLIQKNDGGVYKVVVIQPSYYTLECANGRREAYWVHEIDNFFTLYKVDVDCTIEKGSVKGVPMTAEKKLELIRNEIERCITIFGDCEAKCTTCTNDKGCVTCENGEQWEGKAVDNTKTDDELEESPDTDLFTSNEQKAIELCGKNYKNCNEMLCVGCPRQDFLATLIQMADFKDEQFKEELDHAYHCADHVQYMNGWRDAIEKAEDWLYEHSNEYYITAKAYSDFHEAMREEAQK